MALEQFSIVLGVVVGFWTGFVTRSSMFASSSRLFLLSPTYSTIVCFLAHPTRRPDRPWCCSGAWMFFPPAFPATVGPSWAT